jgi:RNA polymerase sigma-70 factor (ECF subfamily)
MTDTGGAAPRQFQTTRWSLVLAAGREDEVGQRALAELCELYWYPLYAYLRRQGKPREEAADLTQGFFARLIEKQDIVRVTTDRGRFRSYLLAAIRNFAANEWHKERAEKRGGGRAISFDSEDAEARYSLEPVDVNSPDKIFARRWALTVLEVVLAQLAKEMEAKGAAEIFARLKVFLEGDGRGPAYAELVDELSMTEGAIKVAVHRMCARFRELLLREVGQTLAEPTDADAELAELLAALRP